MKYFVCILVFCIAQCFATVSITLNGEVNSSMANKVVKGLKTNDKNVILYIDSPGGFVYSEYQIEDAMSAYKARGGYITVVVRGMAASAAAGISCFANKIEMTKGSFRLFHSIAVSTQNGFVKVTKSNVRSFPKEVQEEFRRSHGELQNCGLTNSQINKIENGYALFIYANGRTKYQYGV